VPRPTYAEVNLGAIRRNFRALRGLLEPRIKMLAVVKADAYGHGAVPVARALADEGADMLGVAMVEEGVELRLAGVRTPILVLGTFPRNEVAAAFQYDLRLTIDAVETATRLARLAADRLKPVPVHLKIDTGMNRLGVRAEEAADAAAVVAGLPGLVLEGAYTHLACADVEGHTATPEQLARFREAVEAMRRRGVRPPLVHAANSSSTILAPESHFGMVRPGLAMYGVAPCAAAAARVVLEPAMALRTEVAHLKPVRRGEAASYGHSWRAERDTVLGVLPVGYADGLPRALSNRGRVRIGDRLCPIVGVICMAVTLVDRGVVVSPHVGMAATVMEPRNDSPLSAAAMAETVGTISYEILTGIGKRVPRRYL